MSIAVLPARGGSKRIPRKNVRDFAGQPMITWAIGTALASGLFSRVLVSTDDAEIAAVAREAGAETPFVRPADLSDDHATTAAVMAHAVRWAANDGTDFADAICLYATTPLLAPDDLRAAAAKGAEGWDYVCAAMRFACPVERSFTRAADGGIRILAPEHMATRTQDLPVTFHDAGQFYWGRRTSWLNGGAILGPRTSFVELPRWRAQDIDTQDDWTMAEQIFRSQKGKQA